MYRERIKEAYDKLSPGYQTVADFVLDYPLDAAMMTAVKVGQRLDVDTATVVRLAQRLGYKGYPELQKDIRTVVRDEVRRRMTPATEVPGDAGIFRRNLEAEHRNLDNLVSGLSDETIDKLVGAIVEARTILIVGQWAMLPLGEFFALWLRVLGKRAQIASTDALSAGYAFSDMTDQDVVITFALTGLGAEMANTLQVAKSAGARIVVFASNRSQVIAHLTDVAVVCPSDSAQPMVSFAAAAAAMAGLLQTLIAREPKAYAKGMTAFEESYKALVDGYRS
jgi:DNA-binding MurR/RpiR family transcriptional regulator